MALKTLVANSFLFNLFKLARFSHAKKYLIKALLHHPDPYETYVLSQDKQRSLCIWALKQIKHRGLHYQDDLYFWDLGKERWLANLDHVHGLYEYLNSAFDNLYHYNYNGKVVIDIGGYIGDSARYFLKQGASKVIIYEPVQKNILCMQHNLQQYQDAVEIIPKAIGIENGEMIIPSNYPPGHIGFGNRAGKYSITVQTESFSSLLDHVQADVAKVDCEGYEKCLLEVQDSLLQKIPYWMIEVHNHQIGEQLNEKFKAAGFTHTSVVVSHGHLGIEHYSLI